MNPGIREPGAWVMPVAVAVALMALACAVLALALVMPLCRAIAIVSTLSALGCGWAAVRAVDRHRLF